MADDKMTLEVKENCKTLKLNVEAVNPKAVNAQVVHRSRMSLAGEMAKQFCNHIWVADGVVGEWFQVYMTSPCIDRYGDKNTTTTYIAIKHDESVIDKLTELANAHKAGVANPNDYDHERESRY